jgi:predicted amidohydrolase YtcJ
VRVILGLVILVAASSLITAQKPRADLVVINAKVRTLVSPDSVVEAIAVSSGRIVAVGSQRTVRGYIGPSTRVIDARGRLVLPGFNDAHVHFMGIGNGFSSLDLRGVQSVDEINARIGHFVRFLPKGRWILGGHWSAVAPDKAAVDGIATDNPVFIYQAGGQAAFGNAVAFDLAGLKSETGIEVNDKGRPTGLVRGEALRRLARAVPADHIRDWPAIAEAATNYAASLGVTSAQDMHSDDSRAVYRELHRHGKLKTRIYDCLSLPDWKKLDEFPLERKDRMVRGGCLKSFSDGDEAAAPKLLRAVSDADRAGFQIMLHAIGNTANGIVLDVFEQVTKLNGPRDRRLRVEHGHNPRVTDLPRFSRSGIVVSMQPHLFDGGNGSYYAGLLKLKSSIAFGSDAAITDLNPLLGIHEAVNAGAESISVYEAVTAYTLGSAYAEFQEKEKGTIEVGKLADFVILSDDVFTTDRVRIRDVSVLLTVVGGRVVYQSN